MRYKVSQIQQKNTYLRMLCKNKKCNKGNFGKRAKFEQKSPSHLYCSQECLFEDMHTEAYKKKVAAEIKKESNEKTKKLKESIKTHSDYIRELQKVFNSYIRKRDEEKPCISCGRPLRGKFDAGHAMSCGAYPNLRFNEDNVHGQCVHCNQHKHGNISEYMVNLPNRIGIERFDLLMSQRKEPLKITIPEIKEKIQHYKNKIRLLE